MKKLFVLLVALVTAAGTATAQQVRFTAATTVAIDQAADQFVFTGKPVASLAGTVGDCWAGYGFEDPSPGAHLVIVNPSSGEKTVDVWTDQPVQPGTRLTSVQLIGNCAVGTDMHNVFEGDAVAPNQGGSLLVAAPAGVTLLPEDEAVIKSDEDGTGVADAVCVQPGSPAVHTELWSDIPLLRGDRLADFQFIFYDPATGETYYHAYLEY